MTVAVEFCGEQFRLADKAGMMPLMRLARAQQRVANQADPTDEDAAEVIVALLDHIEQCIVTEDASRFERVATASRAGMDELEDFSNRLMEAMAARPTVRPASSSDGPLTIEPSSTVDSSSRVTGPEAVIHRFNTQEHPRPDLANIVHLRQESQAS